VQQVSLLAALGLVVLVAVGLTALIGFVCGTLAARADAKRPCPACQQAALRWVTAVRATIEVDGQRAPDSWAFYECRACGTRLKDHRGQWKQPTDSDLRHFEGA